jgi:hypothetical protein
MTTILAAKTVWQSFSRDLAAKYRLAKQVHDDRRAHQLQLRRSLLSLADTVASLHKHSNGTDVSEKQFIKLQSQLDQARRFLIAAGKEVSK